MAFREFRHLRDAQPRLKSLAAAGAPLAEVADRTREVMAGYRPKAGDSSQHVAPFHGHYLGFVASDV